jgi:hypothetical protein
MTVNVSCCCHSWKSCPCPSLLNQNLAPDWCFTCQPWTWLSGSMGKYCLWMLLLIQFLCPRGLPYVNVLHGPLYCSYLSFLTYVWSSLLLYMSWNVRFITPSVYSCTYYILHIASSDSMMSLIILTHIILVCQLLLMKTLYLIWFSHVNPSPDSI